MCAARPPWKDHSGPHFCSIIDQKRQRALGWEKGPVTVANNTVFDVGDVGLFVQADDAVVMNNLLFDNDNGKRQAFISGEDMQSDHNAFRGTMKSLAEGENTIVLTGRQKQQLKADLADKSFTLPSTVAVVDEGAALDGVSVRQV